MKQKLRFWNSQQRQAATAQPAQILYVASVFAGVAEDICRLNKSIALQDRCGCTFEECIIVK